MPFPEFDPTVPHRPEEGRQWLRDKALYDAIVAMTDLLKQLAYPTLIAKGSDIEEQR